MALDLEWRDRINSWKACLANQFYRPIAAVELEGHLTRDRLTPRQARAGAFRAMPVGTAWGAKWEYGWFRAQIVVPKDAAGRRIVFRCGCGGECLVLVNGSAAGALSWGRSEITLTRGARAGEKFDILLEAYAGHGGTPCEGGPVPPGRITVPEPPPRQQTIAPTTFGIWEEDAYQLWLDVETLSGLRGVLEPTSLRVSEIDAGLRDFTTIVDFELPPEQWLATVRSARKRLAPLMACRNGSTAPRLFGFGHGHLDTAWLWPLEESYRKAARTVSSQLALAKEYPRHRFLMSQAVQYAWLKRDYPEIWRRLKQAVRKGNIVVDGAMWVEPDTNIAGGEALIRQCIHGKRFFRDEFGIESRVLWLPDVFGYSAALPQILRGCGVDYFSTAKIFWNYHGGESFPHQNFRWTGLDGTSVLAHLFKDYGGPGNAQAAAARWRDRPQADGISSMVFCFGFGDGGGGPTRDHVECVHRIEDLEGSPRVKLSSLAEFFRDLERRGVGGRHYVGELYYQCHRGTYTTQAKVKRGNRKGELALREAEFWSAAASATAGFKYPLARMDAAWKKLLLNQFHDILPGSSITAVYQRAEKDHAEVAAEARRTMQAAMGRLCRKGNENEKALAVFNSLNWPRTALVELPAGFAGAAGPDGKTLPVQKAGRSKLVEVTVPPCGWTTIRPAAPPRRENSGQGVRAERNLLENGLVRVRLNGRGEIVSIFDKLAKSELAAGSCNSMKMYKDVPGNFDAWDIDTSYIGCPVALNEPAEIEVAAAGALVGRLRIRRKINDSMMTQTVSLRRGERRVDFETTVDWRETHKLLKVAFPVNIHASEAVHEIQFGHLRRPNHFSRQFDADRFEVSNHKWSALAKEGRGFAVLNDCKYGLNVRDNTINLTLLRSPKAPDMHADLGVQLFTYSLYFWNGSLPAGGVVRQGYELNCPVQTATGDAGHKSMIGLDSPNVVVEALKPAEDGSGELVVRLYEAHGTACRAAMTTALPARSAALTDMLEEKVYQKLPCRGGRIELHFRAFEIKTIRLNR